MNISPSHRIGVIMSPNAMTPDVVVSAIVAALSAGATKGATDAAKKAVVDAYCGLKSIIRTRFGSHSEAAEAIDKLEVKPDSEGRRQTLGEELQSVNAGTDPELVSAAQTLLALIHALPHEETTSSSRKVKAWRWRTVAALRRSTSWPDLGKMTDSQKQSAFGTGIAQASGPGASATVNIGLRPEEIATLLQAAGAAQQGKIDELAARLNASREAVMGFLRILKEDDVPVEQLATKMTFIAQRHVSMLERLAALDPEDVEALGYIEDAQQILRRAVSGADYDRSDELLTAAEEAQGRSLQRVEALEHEAHEAAGRLRRGKAETRAERGELSLTRLDYLQAAHHFHAAAELVSRDHSSLKLNYLVRSAGALCSHGDEKGDNSVLTKAISLYGEVLSEGEARLQEAEAVYRDALKEYTRERTPLHWAMKMHNLGNALLNRGLREGGTERLEEAASAYEDALSERTRERVPLDWESTDQKLSFTQRLLYERGSRWSRSRFSESYDWAGDFSVCDDSASQEAFDERRGEDPMSDAKFSDDWADNCSVCDDSTSQQAYDDCDSSENK